MGRDLTQEIPFTKAIGIFLIVAIVIFISGIIIGEVFFWNRFETLDPLDKDIEYYSGILRKQENNVQAMVELGWRYYRKGNYQEAVKILEKAVATGGGNTAAHFNLGLSYQEISLTGKAEAQFNKVMEIDPNHKLAPFYMGKMYLIQNRIDEAVKMLSKATEVDPASADTLYYLGQAYEAKGHEEEALAAYERALKLVPGHSEIKEAYHRLQARLYKKDN